MRAVWTVGVLAFCLPALGLAQGSTLKAHLQHTFTGHSQEAKGVAWSPDGQVLATSSVDRTVKLWRLSPE